LKLIDSKIDFYGEWLSTGQRPKVDTQDMLNAATKPAKRVRRVA
jgi:hypothetical protein